MTEEWGEHGAERSDFTSETERTELEEACRVLKDQLMERIEYHKDLTDEEILKVIDDLVQEYVRERYLRLGQRGRLRSRLFNGVRRLDILQDLLDDDQVTEIMVNGTEGIYIEREGRLMRWHSRFEQRQKLEDIASRIAGWSNRTANESHAIVDARLQSGARVSIVMNPVAIDGPILTIRRFPDHPISIAELIRWGSVTELVSRFLRLLVISGYNIFISGGTGSGKTTFLNALSGFIPKDERIITIEDNAELQIQDVPNLVRLEARAANEDGGGEITIRDLIRASLRMRPDRIVVGEVRGAETVDMLQALNTGHDGSLSTGHGNSPQDMLSRLETLYSMANLEIPLSAVRRQIASGIDLMVHLGRMRDKSRRVLEIVEIDGYDYQTGEIRLNPLFEFREQGEREDGRVLGKLERVGTLRHRMKLKRAGLEREALCLIEETLENAAEREAC